MKKNELEMLLIGCEKAVTKILTDNPKAGVIVNKGTASETRMRYSEILTCIQKLNTYFGLKGATTVSFSICQTCTKWTTAGHNSQNECLGSCKLNSKKRDFHPDIYHSYDSCEQHSKKGGGAGV